MYPPYLISSAGMLSVYSFLACLLCRLLLYKLAGLSLYRSLWYVLLGLGCQYSYQFSYDPLSVLQIHGTMCLRTNKAHKLHMNISVTLKPGVKDFKYAKSNQELVEIIYSTNYEI